MCQIHSEAQQTETLEFGAEKDILQAMQGEGWLMPSLSPQKETPSGAPQRGWTKHF